ncbi:MAG: peptidylprolyl isomerase [Steroidobacteraceae bacterium]
MTQFFMTPRACLSAVAATALVLSACAKGEPTPTPKVDEKPAPTAVATVNGTPITRSEYDFYVKTLTQGKPVELTTEQKNQVLDELIGMQLMATQGEKDKMQDEPETASRLAMTRMRLLADAESQKYLKGKEPTDEELHAEYDTAVAGIDKTEYHALHILVKDKELAEQLIKKLKGGAKFEDIAKADSIDTGSKVKGGDLGWFTAARMVKPFADAVKGLKKGETTPEPVQTQFGWHIIRLLDTRETPPPPFDQVKEQVKNRVTQKKLEAYVEELKKTAKIDKTL